MFNRSRILFKLIILSTLSVCSFAFAEVRTSTNYQIDNDTISSGGSENSSSASYSIADTLGGFAVGTSTSANYRNDAGYRAAVADSFITITAPSDITLTALSATQNSAVGSSTWTIETGDTGGYTLTIKASTTPALKATSTGESFSDFGTSSASTWSVSNKYIFGWSGFGSHVGGFGSGSSCAASTNVPSATLLWRGFYGTTTYIVASSSASNPGGTPTTACFATEQNGVFAPAGNYRADITLTATPN